MAFSTRVNLHMMRAFEAEGIEFAFLTTTNYLAQDQRRPLQISIANESQLMQPGGTQTPV
jgi:MscS family membrane protein